MFNIRKDDIIFELYMPGEEERTVLGSRDSRETNKKDLAFVFLGAALIPYVQATILNLTHP